MSKTPEERAYLIMTLFGKMKDRKQKNNEAVPAEISEYYDRWLISSENKDAKEKAMQRLYNETVLKI